jgi:hypothetical protein
MFTPIMDLDQQTQHQQQLWREAEQHHLAHIAQNQQIQTPTQSAMKRFVNILTMTTLSR